MAPKKPKTPNNKKIKPKIQGIPEDANVRIVEITPRKILTVILLIIF